MRDTGRKTISDFTATLCEWLKINENFSCLLAHPNCQNLPRYSCSLLLLHFHVSRRARSRSAGPEFLLSTDLLQEVLFKAHIYIASYESLRVTYFITKRQVAGEWAWKRTNLHQQSP